MEKIECDIPGKIALIEDLPAPSPILERLISILPDDDNASSDLDEVISIDPGVSAQVLKVANSAYFGFSGRISTISKAILLLGPREVWSIAVGVAFKQQFSGIFTSPVFDLEKFWRHSFFTGIIEGFMAKEMKVSEVKGDEAMIMGLLHDLGRLILASHFAQEYEQIEAHRREHGLTLIEAERDKGLLHTEVGEVLCRCWKLPKAIQAAVSEHHYHEISTDEDPSIHGVLTGISNLVAKSLEDDGELSLDSGPLSQALMGYEWARPLVEKVQEGEESIRQHVDEIMRLIHGG